MAPSFASHPKDMKSRNTIWVYPRTSRATMNPFPEDTPGEFAGKMILFAFFMSFYGLIFWYPRKAQNTNDNIRHFVTENNEGKMKNEGPEGKDTMENHPSPPSARRPSNGFSFISLWIPQSLESSSNHLAQQTIRTCKLCYEPFPVIKFPPNSRRVDKYDDISDHLSESRGLSLAFQQTYGRYQSSEPRLRAFLAKNRNLGMELGGAKDTYTALVIGLQTFRI